MEKSQQKKKDNKENKSEKTLNERVRFTNKVIKQGLRTVSQHHIDSFDYGLGKCLPRICKYMLPVEVAQLPQLVGKEGERAWPFKKYLMWFENFEIRRPQRPNANNSGLSVKLGKEDSASERALIYPYECRRRSLTYSAPMYATVCRKIDDEPEEKITICLGDIPVMVRS